MTNRERLTEMKRVEPVIAHIKKCAQEIIHDTYDYHVNDIIEVAVHAKDIKLVCSGYSYGEIYTDYYVIPIEWFDEGFDYVKAYEKILRKEEANRKRAEKARLKRAAEKRKKAKELKAKKEYDKYLKLKKKYENGDLT